MNSDDTSSTHCTVMIRYMYMMLTSFARFSTAAMITPPPSESRRCLSSSKSPIIKVVCAYSRVLNKSPRRAIYRRAEPDDPADISSRAGCFNKTLMHHDEKMRIIMQMASRRCEFARRYTRSTMSTMSCTMRLLVGTAYSHTSSYRSDTRISVHERNDSHCHHRTAARLYSPWLLSSSRQTQNDRASFHDKPSITMMTHTCRAYYCHGPINTIALFRVKFIRL